VAIIRPAARRYAEAIFGLAEQDQSFDAWASDLDRLAELLDVAAAEHALASPALTVTQKLNIFRAEIPELRPASGNLLRLLLHRGRLNLLPEIALAYGELLNRSRGIATAHVTTAIPLDDASRAQLVARLTQYTGQRVQLEASVDPTVMGGVVARIGDLLIDGSVRGRLEALRRRLAATSRL
jgi:F-type H+-transporting ATPase subunit delta